MSVEVLREIRLYGPLGRQFGRVHRLAVLTPAEAVQALCAVLPGFERAFLGCPGTPGRYHVFVGRGAHRECIGTADINEPVAAVEPIRIVPVIEGAKRGGFLQIIIGAALIFMGAPQLGMALILGGVTQLLSPQRQGGAAPKADNQPSYGFDSGPVNTTQQGLPVPVALGRVIIGSAEVSAGLATDDMVIASPATTIAPNALPAWQPADWMTNVGGA